MSNVSLNNSKASSDAIAEAKTSLDNSPKLVESKIPIPSYNPSVDEWPEDSSNSKESTPIIDSNQSKIELILRKSQSHTNERSLDQKNYQSPCMEKVIKKALLEYFQGLMERADEENFTSSKFNRAVKEYVLEASKEQDIQVIQESDNLLWKCLELTRQLSVISQIKVQKNSEMLKMYIATLGSQVKNNFIFETTCQLTIQNQKYCETKFSIAKGIEEKKALLLIDENSLDSTGKWHQIDKSLKESKILVKIDCIQKIRFRQTSPSSSWFCVLKVDDLEVGKTQIAKSPINPTWNSEMCINLSPETPFEMIKLEVYESTSPSLLVGECFVLLQEILENTLIKKKFRVELPITRAKHIFSPLGIDKGTNFSIASLREELTHTMTEREFTDCLNEAIHGNNIGLLRTSFEVNLDPTFLDIIKEVKAQRIENLEVLVEEHQIQLDEQFEYLKFSIEPIYTLELHPIFGIQRKKAKEEVKTRDKYIGCGMLSCASKYDCNLF